MSAMEPIMLQAKVVKGFGRGGKQLGCPTANLSCDDLGGQVLLELPTGIYCGFATVDGQGPYKAVTSIGWNPYFDNKEKTVEPHLLHDFDADFYGSTIKLVLCCHLRPELNFNSLEDLVAAIQKDIADSKQLLTTAPFQAFKAHAFLQKDP